jgi:hypothetical protein
MRQVWIVLSLSLLMMFMAACTGGIGIENTQINIPSSVTKPTAAIGDNETATVEFPTMTELTSTPSNGTLSASGLSINLEDIKSVMLVTQRFAFTDSTVDNKPVSIAKLTPASAANFPTFETGFSAAFIGNPENLNEIKITVPRTEDQTTGNDGVGLMTMMFASVLPTDVQSQFLTWINQNYVTMPVGASKEITVKNFKFTLSRTSTKLDFIHLQINKKQGRLKQTLRQEVAYANPANKI